jgi:hypothetical protein
MEINKTICKTCGQIKDRIAAGKFNSKDRKWSDQSGKLWNGKICPPCNSDRVKEAMRVKRNVKAD